MTPATPEAPTIEAAEAAVRWPYRTSYGTIQRLGELAPFRSEDHIGLLDGISVRTMTKGPAPRPTVNESLFPVARIAPEGWSVRPGPPIALRGGPSGDGAPEPDIAVVVGRHADSRRRHREPHEVALVIEVASSAAASRAERGGLVRCAFADIPVACNAGLHDSTSLIHTEPSGPADDPQYGRVEVKRPGEFFRSLAPSIRRAAARGARAAARRLVLPAEPLITPSRRWTSACST